MQLGNGRWESTAFNERLQPTQIALGTTPNATNLLKLNFEYGKLNWDGSTLAGTNNGNVSKQTINTPNTGGTYGFVATQYYTYDALNRSEIASENLQPNDGSPLINGWRQNFSYDRYGNRRFIITGDSSTTTIPAGCADVVCNPTANQANNRLDGYTYDASGNTKIDASGRQFSYDAENKQTEVKDANSVVVGRYYYDGDGKRVKKVSATETTIFVYDAGGKLIAEYSNQSSQTPQISYLTQDHLGSPRIITDGSGNVISRRDFQPFGEEVRTWYRMPNLGYAVADDVRQKFTGYERDDESDLDFAQARMYSNRLGRFSSTDPALSSGRIYDPQTWNRYCYTLNNPLIYTDPTGLYVFGASLGGNVTDEELRNDAGTDKRKLKEIEKIIAKRNEFRNALTSAASARDALSAGADRDLVSGALASYGTEGIANDVTVITGNLAKGVAAETSTTFETDSKEPYGTKSINVVTLNNKENSGNLAVDVAHEGRHVADSKDFAAAQTADPLNALNGSLNRTKYEREVRGYTVSSLVAKGLGLDNLNFSGNEVWNKGWRTADVENKRSKAINTILRTSDTYLLTPEGTQPGPGARFVPR